jgi:hypothetical protein
VTGLHLPHPHIADKFASVFEQAAQHLHRTDPIAPQRDIAAAEDWDGWHYPDTQGYMEVEE